MKSTFLLYLLHLKTQIQIRHLFLLGCLLLFLTTSGCSILPNVNRVIRLDPIFLTFGDLPDMRITDSHPISRPVYERSNRRVGKRIHAIGKKSIEDRVIGFEQRWNGSELVVKYWFFDSYELARNAAESRWTWTYAAPSNFHQEVNPDDVIGEATWRHINTRWEELDMFLTDIYFVKQNVLVSIRSNGDPSVQLPLARKVARMIEAKIDAVLEKK